MTFVTFASEKIQQVKKRDEYTVPRVLSAGWMHKSIFCSTPACKKKKEYFLKSGAD